MPRSAEHPAECRASSLDSFVQVLGAQRLAASMYTRHTAIHIYRENYSYCRSELVPVQRAATALSNTLAVGRIRGRSCAADLPCTASPRCD